MQAAGYKTVKLCGLRDPQMVIGLEGCGTRLFTPAPLLKKMQSKGEKQLGPGFVERS